MNRRRLGGALLILVAIACARGRPASPGPPPQATMPQPTLPPPAAPEVAPPGGAVAAPTPWPSPADTGAIRLLDAAARVATDSAATAVQLLQALESAGQAAELLAVERRLRNADRQEWQLGYEASLVVSLIAGRAAVALFADAQRSGQCDRARAAMAAAATSVRYFQHCEACPAGYAEALDGAARVGSAGPRLVRTLCGSG